MHDSEVQGRAEHLDVFGGGDRYDVDRTGLAGAELTQQFDTGKVGQVHVEQDKVGPQRRDAGQALPAAGRLADDLESADPHGEIAVH